MEFPFYLRYELNRRQRLIPHLCIWGPFLPGVALILLGIIFLARLGHPGWALCATLFGLWMTRGFFVGLFYVIRHPVQPMEIEVREDALGVDDGTGKGWLWHSGFMRIERIENDTWTLQHFNGSVLHIPASAITDEQLRYIRSVVPPEQPRPE